jgi:hypothetical protein
MAETPSGPTIDPRLRSYLDAELRQAEVDFARLPRPVARRARRGAPIATLLASAVVLLLAVVAGSQLLGRPNTGPAAIQLGADGVPTSIDGQPVLRGGDITKRAGSAGWFLAGGTLALASDPCPTPEQPSAAPCMETWSLVDSAGAGPVIGLSGISGAPGFVQTSGALTVVRVDGIPGPSAAASPCSNCPGTLTVEAVVWRRPTKGPMPPNASPPQGGPIFDALVPDFVAASNRDGTAIAGYVPKSYLVGPVAELPGSPSNPPQPLPVPVYADDLTTLVGHMVADVGFVPLGAAPPPGGPDASVAPSPDGSPSAAPGTIPTVDCGRIGAAPCERAIALARAGNEAEVRGATVIVVDDACAPLPVICDRLYPFDAIVVFVTAGADRTGWYSFEVTGLADSTPTTAKPLSYAIPQHIVQRVAAALLPAPSSAPIPSAFASGLFDWIPVDASQLGGAGLDAVTTMTDGRLLGIGRPLMTAPGHDTFDSSFWVSPDGRTWSRMPGSAPLAASTAGWSGAALDVARVGSGYVAVGMDQAGDASGANASAWFSADGAHWTRAAVADGLGRTMDQIIATKDGLVALGEAGYTFHAGFGSGTAIWTSTDGRSWARVPAKDAPPLGTRLYGAIRVGDGYLAMAEFEAALGSGQDQEKPVTAGVWRSTDAVHWQAIAGTPLGMRAIVATSDGLIGVGSGQAMNPTPGLAWQSADGSTWTSAPLPTPGALSGGAGLDALTVVNASSGLLAVGERSDDPYTMVAWSSPDGRSWTAADLPVAPGTTFDHAFAFNGGVLVVGETHPDTGSVPVMWLVTGR